MMMIIIIIIIIIIITIIIILVHAYVIFAFLSMPAVLAAVMYGKEM